MINYQRSLKLGVPTDVNETDLKRAYRKAAIKVQGIFTLTMLWNDTSTYSSIIPIKIEPQTRPKSSTKLGGLAYEMQPNDKADLALDSFKVAFETPGNIPVTLIHPLSGTVDAKNLPPPDTPPQFAQVCFTLPTIRKASEVQGDNERTDRHCAATFLT